MQRSQRKTNRRALALSKAAQPEYLNILLRGGRMTKLAGVAASFAPTLGTVGMALSTGVSAIALGGALTVTGAQAGSCTYGGGVYTCSGPADPGTDVTQSLNPAGPLTVVTDPGFGIDTNAGDAFNLGGATTTDIDFEDLNNSYISGAANGFYAYSNNASNFLTINTTGTVTGTTGRGFDVFNQGIGATLVRNQNAAGTASVTGQEDGIYVYGGFSTTTLTIETNNVTSYDNQAIDASHFGSGDLTVTSTNTGGTATVTGYFTGIDAEHFGAGMGSIFITANNVSATNGTAISAYNQNGANITITTDGTVAGANGNGIESYNSGTGSSIITTTNAAGDSTVSGTADGINAFNSGTSLTITANNVTGNTGSGIYANNMGTGGLTVTATNAAGTAQVTGDNNGIAARNSGGGSLSVTANRVMSTYNAGIYAYNDVLGTGVIVTADDEVQSAASRGISVSNFGGGSTRVIASNGDGDALVNSSLTGIYVYAGGLSTSVLVDANTVTSSNGDGVNVFNFGSGPTTVTVENADGTGLASGSGNGIYAYGGTMSGAMTITTDDVTSTGSTAIQVTNRGSGGLTVDATNDAGDADVIGDIYGIEARNYNGGALSVTANRVSGELAGGIIAYNDSSSTSLSVTADDQVLSANGNGIEARNLGSGSTLINATNSAGDALVDGQNFGIYGYGGATTTSMTINGNLASSNAGDGVYALHFGTGPLGVNITNADGTGQANGAGYGIFARSEGSSLSVEADNVIGIGNDGLYAYLGPGGADMLLRLNGTAQGASDGVSAENQGTGNLSVLITNTDGTASATGGDFGLNARNYNGGNLSITADNATGTIFDGIYAYNGAGGDGLNILSSGTVTGTGRNGIYARNQGTGDLLISSSNPNGTAQATGAIYGILANNYNGGALSVVADNVTGTANDGISAYNDASGTDLLITTTGTATGGAYGLSALNLGSGDLNVAATNDSGTAQAVGGTDGIYVYNFNGGALNITADNATGTTRNGINAYNAFPGTSLSITSTGDAIGDFVGIFAVNLGAGDLNIYSTNPDGTAQVTGFGGIVAINNSGGAINIIADNTTGQLDAIYANNGPAGSSISIVSYGTSTSDTYGIRAYNNGTGDLSITAQNSNGTASVTGGVDGITGNNYLGGALSIAADNVTGTANDGITAYNDGAGTSVSVTTIGTVVGGDEGIDVVNIGSGGVTVMATNPDGTASTTGVDKGIDVFNLNGGAVTVMADNAYATGMEDGVYTYNDAAGTTTQVTTYGTVTGADNGIYALHLGTEPLSVTVSGTTTGTATAGIYTTTGLGGQSIITLNDGADVSGGLFAILNDDGDSNTYFNDGSTVSGTSQFGDGSDNLTIAGANIVGADILDGGDDSDTADGFNDVLTFNGFNGSFGADLLNWEEVIFDNSTATFTGASITAPTVALQNGTLFSPSQTGFILNTELSIDGTSEFNAGLGGAGNVQINGDVANAGTLSVIDDTIGDQLTVNGNLTGSGDLGLDVDVGTGTADRISIVGDANGPGGISVNGFGSSMTPAEIPLVDVGGATSDAAFDLSSSNFTLPGGENAQVIGAFVYQLGFDAPGNEFFITPFDASGSVIFNPVTTVIEAYPTQLTLLNTPGSTFQSWGNRPAVGQGAVAQNLFNFDPSPENAIWFSLTGSRSEYQGQSTLNTDVDTDVSGFEMGVDFPVFEGQSGRLVAGASFALQEADTDITAAIATAGINTTGNSLTLSAIWLSDSRFYANGQLRYSTFSSDMVLSGVGPVALGTQGEGVAASIELGQAFALSDRLTLVPQVQLTHSDVKGDGIADPFGSPFAGTITDGETTTARVGLYAERVTGRGSLFGSISYIHAFDADTTVNFAGFPFTTSLDENRIQVRAGGQIAIGENSQLFGALTAQGGLSDFGDDNTYGITGGVRVNF